jgi:hypothetical protein
LQDRGTPGTRLTLLLQDGFDPDSTSDVLLEDSFFSTGDDGVAIKSGWDCYGVAVGVPSSNITIRNLTVLSPTSAGVCIGSEMSGGVSDVSVTDSTFVHCSTGIRVKSGRARGGFVRDVDYRNIGIAGPLSAAILVDADYGGDPAGCPAVQPFPPPDISNLSFTNIRATDCVGNYMQLRGLLDAPTTLLRVQNVSFASRLGVLSGYKCAGGVSGLYSDLTPVPPQECGLTPAHVARPRVASD